jgi:hypothetical protein
MPPLIGFAGFLGLTVSLLGVVVASGLKARLRVHLPAVALALASLGVTIYFAEKLGREFDLKAAGAIYPVHLFVAKVATAAYLLPIATGVRTLRDRTRRRAHFASAMLVLALTVLTAITGTWMLLAAPRLP